jgi:hypothetical protein
VYCGYEVKAVDGYVNVGETVDVGAYSMAVLSAGRYF